MYDVTVIGPSVIDILAAPFDPEALAKGKRDVDQIRMSFGGDALNESVVLSRMGKKVQLISKIGADEAGRSIRKHLEKEKVSTKHVIVEQGLNTSVNIALVDADGGRKFLTDPHSSQRKLGLEDVLPMLDETAPIVSFASIFISPCFSIEKTEQLFSRIKAAGKTLVSDVTRPKNGETFDDLKFLFPYMADHGGGGVPQYPGPIHRQGWMPDRNKRRYPSCPGCSRREVRGYYRRRRLLCCRIDCRACGRQKHRGLRASWLCSGFLFD